MEENGASLKTYASQLHNFLEAFYFENEDLLILKLALFKLAIRKIPTGKMIFEIGNGGDGKSINSILERNLFGTINSCVLDCAVFTDK